MLIVSKDGYAGISHSQNYALLERLLFRLAKKWIPGHTYKDAMSAAKETNNTGMSAILNFLGEDSIDATQIEQTVNEYCLLLALLKSNRIDSSISVKPTQIGLRINYETCLYNFKQIANKANGLGKFIWIDIESCQFV